MRQTLLVSALFSPLLLAALSCAKAPVLTKFERQGADGVGGKPDSSQLPSAGTPEGVVQDPFKEPETLNLSAISAESDVIKTFDLTKISEMSWNSSKEIIFSHGNGQSLSYDFQAKAWMAIHTSTILTEFQTIFDFRDAGFFAIDAEGLNLKGAQTKIVRVPLPEGFAEASIVGSNPGFLAYKSGEDINVILAGESGANLFSLKDAPVGTKLVYPCNLHCLFWGYDDKRISVYFAKEGWRLLDQVIELPAGETISRMAIRFRAENNPVAAEFIAVQTASSKLFAQAATDAAKPDASWEEIQYLSDRYCKTCHEVDGFDKIRTWTDKKDSVIHRLELAANSPLAMPPPDVKGGAQISAREKATLLAWMKLQVKTIPGEIGTGDGGGNVDAPLAGDLKNLAEAHCLSCHKDATKTKWWRERRASVISQVNDGTMPKGKTVSAGIKSQFEAAVKALK